MYIYLYICGMCLCVCAHVCKLHAVVGYVFLSLIYFDLRFKQDFSLARLFETQSKEEIPILSQPFPTEVSLNDLVHKWG